MSFNISRAVAFHETDLMGIVHHANYLKFFEEARVAWLLQSGLGKFHFPATDRLLAVVSTRVEHKSPCRFLDQIDVFVQTRLEGLKIEFQYAIKDSPSGRLIALGSSSHIMVGSDLKPKKLDREFLQEMEKRRWTETWL